MPPVMFEIEGARESLPVSPDSGLCSQRQEGAFTETGDVHKPPHPYLRMVTFVNASCFIFAMFYLS